MTKLIQRIMMLIYITRISFDNSHFKSKNYLNTISTIQFLNKYCILYIREEAIMNYNDNNILLASVQYLKGSSATYHYIVNDQAINIRDIVLIDSQGIKTYGIVKNMQSYPKNETPYPYNKLKPIIKRITTEDELNQWLEKYNSNCLSNVDSLPEDIQNILKQYIMKKDIEEKHDSKDEEYYELFPNDRNIPEDEFEDEEEIDIIPDHIFQMHEEAERRQKEFDAAFYARLAKEEKEDQKQRELEELEEEKEIELKLMKDQLNQASAIFIPNKRVSSYMQVDTINKLVKFNKTIFKYEDIITYQVIDDYEEGADTNLTLPVIGGILGGIKQYLIGVMLFTEIFNICNELQICVTTAEGDIYLEFVTQPMNTDKRKYKKRKKECTECEKLLKMILKDNERNGC